MNPKLFEFYTMIFKYDPSLCSKCHAHIARMKPPVEIRYPERIL